MTGEPLRRTVTVRNSQGLHIRPATSFSQLASAFQSEVFIYRPGEEKISAKSPMGLLGLGAAQGTELIIEVSGPDAQLAMMALVKFFDDLPTLDLE